MFLANFLEMEMSDKQLFETLAAWMNNGVEVNFSEAGFEVEEISVSPVTE